MGLGETEQSTTPHHVYEPLWFAIEPKFHLTGFVLAYPALAPANVTPGGMSSDIKALAFVLG